MMRNLKIIELFAGAKAIKSFRAKGIYYSSIASQSLTYNASSYQISQKNLLIHKGYVDQSRKFSIEKYQKPDHDITKLYRTKTLYRNILEAFPRGIQMAFAYGSGAIKQENQDMSKNVLDFIFVVDNPEEWHDMNLKIHRKHYSFLKYFGPRILTQVQESFGGGVYFNTLVTMQNRTIKYGVVSTESFIRDLLDWDLLYLSGRVHKPINIIVVPSNSELMEALIENLESATHAALLLLPDVFSEEQLYTTIANLSYSGDIRMTFAEDNNKVRNIVKANMVYFRRMYLPIILRMEHVNFWEETGQIEQTLNFESRHYHLTRLPSGVMHGLLKQKYKKGIFPDLEEVIEIHSDDTKCGERVSKSIRNIVRKSSRTQTLKGFLMAGFRKSIVYSYKKVAKSIKSR